MSVGDLDSNPFSMAPDGRFTLSASVENDVTYCGFSVSGSQGRVVSVRIGTYRSDCGRSVRYLRTPESAPVSRQTVPLPFSVPDRCFFGVTDSLWVVSYIVFFTMCCRVYLVFCVGVCVCACACARASM